MPELNFYPKTFLSAISYFTNMQCNGSCKQYKASGNTREGGRYEQGQKRCHRCEIYMVWEGLWCPYCGYLLRTKPRCTKLKRRLMLMKISKQESNL